MVNIAIVNSLSLGGTQKTVVIVPILPLNMAKTNGRAENFTVALASGSYLHTKLVLAAFCGSQPEIPDDLYV